MNIQKYLAFLKTVEFGSFTKAARALNYTQSAISHMISDLESDWGLALLERDRSGVRITSGGLRLLPLIREICDGQRRLQGEVDEMHSLGSGLIRIGTFSSVATHWLPNMITTFQRDYPNMDFEFLQGDYDEIETWILDGRVDCGFVRLPGKAGLENIFLEQDRLMAIIPENHPLAACDRFPLPALLDDPFMLLEKGSRDEISKIFDRHGLTPKIHFITWDDYAIMAMVEKGLGISILPELILRRTPYRILAKELEIPAYRRIGFAVRDFRQITPAVKRFMDYLKYRDDPLKDAEREIG